MQKDIVPGLKFKSIAKGLKTPENLRESGWEQELIKAQAIIKLNLTMLPEHNPPSAVVLYLLSVPSQFKQLQTPSSSAGGVVGTFFL